MVWEREEWVKAKGCPTALFFISKCFSLSDICISHRIVLFAAGYCLENGEKKKNKKIPKGWGMKKKKKKKATA